MAQVRELTEVGIRSAERSLKAGENPPRPCTSQEGTFQENLLRRPLLRRPLLTRPPQGRPPWRRPPLRRPGSQLLSLHRSWRLRREVKRLEGASLGPSGRGQLPLQKWKPRRGTPEPTSPGGALAQGPGGSHRNRRLPQGPQEASEIMSRSCQEEKLIEACRSWQAQSGCGGSRFATGNSIHHGRGTGGICGHRWDGHPM